MVEHHGQARCQPRQSLALRRECGGVDPELGMPAEVEHRRQQCLHRVPADAAPVVRPTFGMEEVEAQAAHPGIVPPPQQRGVGAGRHDGHAAQPRGCRRQRRQQGAVVQAVHVGLHHHAAFEAQTVEVP